MFYFLIFISYHSNCYIAIYGRCTTVPISNGLIRNRHIIKKIPNRHTQCNSYFF